MAGEVEAPPEVAGGGAGVPASEPRHLAQPGLGLDGGEQRGHAQPHRRGHHQPGQLVLHDGHAAAAEGISSLSLSSSHHHHYHQLSPVGVAGPVDEVGHQQPGPEPAELHEPLVQNIVRVGEVTPGTVTSRNWLTVGGISVTLSVFGDK